MLNISIKLAIFIYIIGIIMYLSLGSKQNLIYILIALEILLLSIALLFIILSFILDDILGSFITLLILPLAGAESALGLSL